MKDYPSIPKQIKSGNGLMWVFDKLDGSNLRFEWNPKSGFYKFGSRTRLFDETDPILGPAKPLFLNTLAEPLAQIARKQRWESAVFFAEFYGPQSFAGQHVAGDAFTLSLFDVAPFKKGILGPEEFVDLFGQIPNIAALLGRYAWNADFVEAVRQGAIPGITSEGVIGKRGSGHKLEMVKAKTQVWIDRVRAQYDAADAEKILAS